MGKQETLRHMQQTWVEFTLTFSDLSTDLLLKSTNDGHWSIKDILGHVSTWEEEALTCLPIILRGERPPSYRAKYGGIDNFNALQAQQKAAIPITQILQEINATHERLISYLESIPEENFKSGTRFLRRLGWDTFKHYPEHAKAIRERRGGK